MDISGNHVNHALYEGKQMALIFKIIILASMPVEAYLQVAYESGGLRGASQTGLAVMDSDHRRGMGVNRNFYHGQSRAADFARFFRV
jgi:hypothetical protein